MQHLDQIYTTYEALGASGLTPIFVKFDQMA